MSPVITASAPGLPTGLTHGAATGTTMPLSWTAPASGRRGGELFGALVIGGCEHLDCVSAWKKDPVGGVIGVLKGPLW